MSRFPVLLLVLAISAAGCGNDNSWNGRYTVDGEWEVWTAASSNACFMLAVGTPYYVASFEPDSGAADFLFTGSDAGELCWTRQYVRTGNELVFDEAPYTVAVTADCTVQIDRRRVAVFNSSDTFSETSTVEVTWVSGDGCPADSLPCEATFVSLGVRCDGCYVACDAAAMSADPELATTLIDGSGAR